MKVSRPSETQCAQPLELADLPLFNVSFSDVTCGKAEKAVCMRVSDGEGSIGEQKSRGHSATTTDHKTEPQFCTSHYFI